MYSATYLTTPLLIAPFPIVKAIDIKLVNAPTDATPIGPVYMAIIFPAKKPDEILTKVIMAEKTLVLIKFTLIFHLL